jgi:hypothetical protein
LLVELGHQLNVDLKWDQYGVQSKFHCEGAALPSHSKAIQSRRIASSSAKSIAQSSPAEHLIPKYVGSAAAMFLLAQTVY